MIAEFILSAVMGLIAGAILSWFFFRMRKKRMEKPQRIIDNLEKQEKEGKVFYVDGKPINFRDSLAPEKVHNFIEELRQEQAKEPYHPTAELPPLPPPPLPKYSYPPLPKSEDVKRMIERDSDTEVKEEPKKKSSNSLNKMLGRR